MAVVEEAVGSAGPASDDRRRTVRDALPLADRAYRSGAAMAGLFSLVLMALIGAFLWTEGAPALQARGVIKFLTTFEWSPETGVFGIGAVIAGTVIIAVTAMTLAVPVSVMTALFINEYAPRRLRSFLTGLVDLLAAVPSLIFGLWGFFFLQERVQGPSRWTSDHLGFIPFFKNDLGDSTGSPLIAALVVALMVLPICTSVMREVFSLTPPVEKEGALALGSTRWGMIRTVVLPFGTGGIIGGSMLGLGRALGETIAVLIIISPSFEVSPRILERGGNSIASLIALRWSEASQAIGLPALMAAGLVLFIMTLAVNMAATAVVSRSRSGAGVDG